jgi:hypothetical protein
LCCGGKVKKRQVNLRRKFLDGLILPNSSIYHTCCKHVVGVLKILLFPGHIFTFVYITHYINLMTRFYLSLMENRTDSSKLSVRSKRQAFLKAQKELKVEDAANSGAKYPSPYYWGAFVMVGE